MSYIRAFVPLKHPACARQRLLEALTANQRTAQEHGLEARIFESGELALDIDEPEDLDSWRRYDSPTNVNGADRCENASLAGSRGSLPGNRIDDVVRPG